MFYIRTNTFYWSKGETLFDAMEKMKEMTSKPFECKIGWTNDPKAYVDNINGGLMIHEGDFEYIHIGTFKYSQGRFKLLEEKS